MAPVIILKQPLIPRWRCPRKNFIFFLAFGKSAGRRRIAGFMVDELVHAPRRRISGFMADEHVQAPLRRISELTLDEHVHNSRRRRAEFKRGFQ